MSNRLRKDIDEEELEAKLQAEMPAEELPENFFTLMFTKGIISTDAATRALPFVLYLAFLAMIYIGNRHFAEKNIREIDKLDKEVKELNWDYKTAKAELAFKSTRGEVSQRADSLGLKETLEPPQKLTVTLDKDEHQN